MWCWSHQGYIFRRHRLLKWWIWPVCHFKDRIAVKWLFKYFTGWPAIVCDWTTNRGAVWFTLQISANRITKVVIVSIEIVVSSFYLLIPDLIYSLHLVLVWRQFWTDSTEMPRSLDLPLREALQLSWIIKFDILVDFCRNYSYIRLTFLNNLFLCLNMV